MIHTNRIVTVGEQESIIDRPIVLYRGDREVEIEFTLVGNEFTFSEEGNVIKSVNASHGQLVLNTPSGEHMFSELAECHEGKVVFVVTKEMIDEFIEMGFYSFQIRLYDSAEMKSRVTIPPVMNGFDIRNPIAAEDETNVVDQGIVDYARIFKDQSNEELPTFTWDGEYVKTEWAHHDVITENKMNKIEDALYSINANIKESDVVMLNALDNVKKDADAYVKEHMAEVEADVDEFERNLNTNVQRFKIDTNAAMTAHKNEVSEIVDSFDSQLTHIEESKPYINIKDFGAKGDGVTDDTESFKKAIYDSPNGTTIIIPSGTYLVSNVNKNQSKKNITIKGYGNPTIKLKHTYTPTHLGEYTGSYTVKSYYEEVDFGDKCTVATVTLENGLNYYYFKISDSTIIPAWLAAGSTIKGKNSKAEAYISNIDKNNPDGEGTARIYLYETINYNKGRLNFLTSSGVLTEPILRTPQLNSSRYVIEFADGTIPSYITTGVKLTQLLNGKSCRVQGTTTIDNKKYLLVDSFNTNAIFYEAEQSPLDDNLAFKVEKCSVGSASFITLNKWENVVIEGITFDGANYEVAQKESNANGWNIIYTGACNNLTIRDCSFVNSIMAGLQITGISNAYSPARHDFVSNVLVDNCTFFNNGRGDIEIIQGDTINITNCEGDGYLDIECNSNEILNNVNITFCNFRYTTPYSPGASNSSTSVNYIGCKFQLFENQVGLTTFLTNCKIHHLAVYDAYCNLNGCTVNTLSAGNSYNGNEKLHMSNSYLLGWYTTNPASRNGSEKMVFDNVVIDLSIAPNTLNMYKRNLLWSNVRMISSINFKTINCINMRNSIFANCTFKHIRFFEHNSSAGNVYNNCRFLLLDKTNQSAMFSGNAGGTFNNCYFEATMNSTYGGSIINDCILSYEAKPMFSGYYGLKINGLKDDQNKGIDWYWTNTAWNTEDRILKFRNVWLSKNVPGFLGIKVAYYGVGTNTVLKNSSVFWTDDDSGFMSKVIYTENNTLSLSNL